MENQQFQKWVNLSYLAASAMLAYVVFELSLRLVGTYDLEARVRNIDLIIRGASIGIGAVLFLALFRHQKANNYMNEVMTELSRVTWPTQKETTNATFVVIIMVIVSGVILGALDYLWIFLLKQVL